jgi:molecular chaperone GrpE
MDSRPFFHPSTSGDTMPDHNTPGGEQNMPDTGVSGQTGAPEGAEETGAEISPLQLREIIVALQTESDGLRNQNLRLLADMENLRKRTEREKEETAKYAITRFARDVVTVADNFERAVQAVPQGAAEEDAALKSLVEGVTMTERELMNVLERYSVKRISPKGEMFNPHQHQAMMEMDNAEVAPGTVLEVYQAGYVIEDRILRPAMVIVAKGGTKPAKAEGKTEGAAAPKPTPAEAPDNGGSE